LLPPQQTFVGEVVPAREGLRPLSLLSITFFFLIGEVVPAREGLRRIVVLIRNHRLDQGRRSGSSKRRIKTPLYI